MTVLQVLHKVPKSQKFMIEIYNQPALGLTKGQFKMVQPSDDATELLSSIFEVEVFELCVDHYSGALCIRI